MKFAHIRQILIGTAAALAGLPAFAGNVFPGTLCTSEGSVKKSVTGLMVNTETAVAGTTHFHCPIVHSRYAAAILTSPLTIRVNAKTSDSSTFTFECFIRSVTPSNGTFDTLKLSFGTTSFVGAYQSMENQITLPPSGNAGVNMRCNVPNNFAGSGEAGIVWYSVE